MRAILITKIYQLLVKRNKETSPSQGIQTAAFAMDAHPRRPEHLLHAGATLLAVVKANESLNITECMTARAKKTQNPAKGLRHNDPEGGPLEDEALCGANKPFQRLSGRRCRMTTAPNTFHAYMYCWSRYLRRGLPLTEPSS